MNLLFHKLPVIIALAAFALAAGLFVENSPYPVSPVHTPLIFLLALFGWFYISFGMLRQSPGGYAGGVAFISLALAAGLFPDLWLRQSEATLLGFGISLLGAVLIFQSLQRRPNLRLEVGLLVSAASLIPLMATIYVQWAPAVKIIIAAIGTVVIIIAAAVAWFKRQRSTFPGISSWIFFVLFTTALLWSTFSPLLESNSIRQQFEQYLLFALITLGAMFIADLLHVEQQLRSGPHLELDASLRDPLTNLANRRALELHGPQIITQSHESGRAVSIIIADIDHFKEINDQHGHLAGDAVLRSTAAKLAANVRKSDLAARYGGEEFVIILPGSPLAPTLRLAERMRTAVESETVHYNKLRLKRTISFGVTTAFPEEPASLVELIQRADANLYRAKHEGRNRVLADKLPTDNF